MRNTKPKDSDFAKLGSAGGFNADLLDYNAKLYRNIPGEDIVLGGYGYTKKP